MRFTIGIAVLRGCFSSCWAYSLPLGVSQRDSPPAFLFCAVVLVGAGVIDSLSNFRCANILPAFVFCAVVLVGAGFEIASRCISLRFTIGISVLREAQSHEFGRDGRIWTGAPSATTSSICMLDYSDLMVCL